MTMYPHSDCIPHPEVVDDPLVGGSYQEDVNQDDLVAPVVSVPELQMTWLTSREV